MKASSRKIRPVVFGIRFKFSVIMIAGMTFVSGLIGFALYNQHIRKINDSMKRLSGTVLKGASDPAAQYLRNKDTLISKNSSAARKYAARTGLRKSLKKMNTYFASVIGKEKILDIAFIIDIDWNDPEFDYGSRNKIQYLYKTQYAYFDQRTGRLFTVRGNRRVFNFTWRDGRYDDQLSPTIYKHHMEHIVTDLYLGRKEHVQKGEKDYVITGMPIFDRPYDRRLYWYFLDFSSSQLNRHADHYTIAYNKNNGYCSRTPVDISQLSYRDLVIHHIETDKKFRTIFTERIIDSEMHLDYKIVMDSERKKSLLYRFLVRNYKTVYLPASKRQELRQDFISFLDEKGDTILLSDFRLFFYKLLKQYSIPPKKFSDRPLVWKNFYYYLKYYNIDRRITKTTEDLALISYRKDLAGILGLFLQRKEFSAEMAENKKEIINLIISILIRAFFIALFFPTLIIRKISALSEGALTIGKGRLDKKIELKGSDELGRLADIFNIMTRNLKKAQEEMLIKQRMENELITAQQIQEALLPETLPDIPGIQCAAYYAAQTESGGDYYDFIELDDNSYGITIADVSGHGVGSGLVMAMTRTLLHTYCRKTKNTKKIFEQINSYLKSNTSSNYFVTMFYGILDVKTLKLTYSSAGHNPGIILRKGQLIEVPAGGIALGAASTELFLNHCEIKEVKLNRGDYFIQYTDGIDEAMNSEGEEYGPERFHAVLVKNQGKTPDKLISAVIEDVNTFTRKIPQHDDITLIAIRVD